MMKYLEVVRMVNEILTHYKEATIRQVYYRLVSPPYQYMDNTRSMYTSFDKMMVRAREADAIDWRRIADHTRTEIRPKNSPSDSIEDFIDNLKWNVSDWWTRYTVDLWEEQDCLVKVLIEKDALAQIAADIALPYQVSVIPGRGYNSFTQLKQQAESLAGIDKTMNLLYFGDFDPSGLDIDRSAEARLREYSDADFTLTRIALTEADVVDLPPNPTKSLDSRSAPYVAKYGDRCWELDALPPDVLRDRVRSSIEAHINQEQWQVDRDRWNREKAEIRALIEKWGIDDK